MIKAVIFDCFGVLTTDGWLVFREKYFSNDTDILEQATVFNKRMDAGLISYDDFIRGIAGLAGIPAHEAAAIVESNVANDALFDYIGVKLKQNYKIGVLSNAGINWLDRLFSPRQNALFDATVFSFEVGAIKPDPCMYHEITQRLGVEPQECVFIDDQMRYVEGAEAVGMQGIHFVDTPTTTARLEALLHA